MKIIVMSSLYFYFRFNQKQLTHLNQPLKLNFNYESNFRELVNDNEILRQDNLNLKRNNEKERVFLSLNR